MFVSGINKASRHDGKANVPSHGGHMAVNANHPCVLTGHAMANMQIAQLAGEVSSELRNSSETLKGAILSLWAACEGI